ncbi:site-specific integrase [Albibacterium indicum]|uniref:site-specific integrase n=1 Tax=Albibacterium indicum TaxID=2292082 RepID=UPI000E481626|nr:site-specific integrase [Pedobacter indicus]
MRSANTFGVHFILRMNKEKNGIAPIYVRIAVNGARIEMSLKKKVKVSDWNSSRGLPKAKNTDLKILNGFLEQVRGVLSGYYQEMVMAKKLITPEAIKNMYLGEVEQENTLQSLIEYHNLHMKEVLAYGTLKNYFTTAKYLKRFVLQQFKKPDIYLSELDYKFITQFEYFLRTYEPTDHHKGMANNGVMKHLERFRKMVRLGVKLGWMEKNPFELYKLKMQKVERDFLTSEELSRIEKKDFSVQRIQYAKDLFVFSCYTGIAYIDVMQLTPDNILLGTDGNRWIKTMREKTETSVNVPILPKAAAIIEKYKNNPRAIAQGTMFPVISNQKLNSYLKEVADLCGIKKHLTFHLARHTFATSVTLSNGVPIETVSKMLGHTTIRTTQIYAKVVEQKVSQDMANLRNRLEENEQIALKVLKGSAL